MQFVSSKDIRSNKEIAAFHYILNLRAVKMFEFGAIFLVLVAALIYPTTHFEPRLWMIAPVALAIAAVAAFFTAQKWRRFSVTEFLGWDEKFFYVSQGAKTAKIPWNMLTLENTGLKDPNSGSVLNIQIDDDSPVQLRLVTGFVMIDQFQLVLKTILTHIKENQERDKQITGDSADKADNTADGQDKTNNSTDNADNTGESKSKSDNNTDGADKVNNSADNADNTAEGADKADNTAESENKSDNTAEGDGEH